MRKPRQLFLLIILTLLTFIVITTRKSAPKKRSDPTTPSAALKITEETSYEHKFKQLILQSKADLHISDRKLKAAQYAELIRSKVSAAGVRKAKLLAKEHYKHRREPIQTFCQKHLINEQTSFSQRLEKVTHKAFHWHGHLWYSKDYHFLWCPVPKVGSSSMFIHLLEVFGQSYEQLLDEVEKYKLNRMGLRSTIQSEMFRVPIEETFTNGSLAEDVLTFAFVRHPFARLVSGYSQKIAKDWTKDKHNEYLELRNMLLFRYEGMSPLDPLFASAVPSPDSFAQYLISEGQSHKPEKIDGHFRPQWAHCPFCLYDFDVIGKMDTFNADVKYVFNSLNLTDQIESSIKANDQDKRTQTDSETREKAFFSRLNVSTIQKLYELFKEDFIMFDYDDVDKYLSWGINEP